MPALVIVHRYEQPRDSYGLHTDLPNGTLREGVFWAVGLFDWQSLVDKIDERQFQHINVEVPATDFDLEKLINCAPIEWHSAMRNGEMLERFTVLTTSTEE